MKAVFILDLLVRVLISECDIEFIDTYLCQDKEQDRLTPKFNDRYKENIAGRGDESCEMPLHICALKGVIAFANFPPRLWQSGKIVMSQDNSVNKQTQTP